MSRIKNNKLDEIFENDPLGLLKVEEKSTNNLSTEEQRLVDSFIEICEFYEENGREPSNTNDIGEFTLKARLSAIRKSPEKVRILLPYDFYKLLQGDTIKSISIDDILNDDPLNIITDEDMDDSIFKLSHVKKSDRLRPDHISRRKICKNFSDYEVFFSEVHNQIKEGKRKLIEYTSNDLDEGKYFVLRGVLLYLEKDQSEVKLQDFESGSRIRRDGRTKCIFDNGTESEMLLRSLDKALQLDGFSISDEIQEINQDSDDISDTDIQNGYVYVLKSLCSDPQVSRINDLYKIGYCSGDVTERIKNAANEPTYLMSDVQIITTVRCFNMNVKKLESNIHRFFSDVNINTTIIDGDGRQHSPREWFSAPLAVIEEAIRLIVHDEIQNYRYDKDLQTIVIRK